MDDGQFAAHGGQVPDHGGQVPDHGGQVPDHGGQVAAHGGQVPDHEEEAAAAGGGGRGPLSHRASTVAAGEPEVGAFDPGEAGDELGRSGFASVVGRPNVGKSTLVNRLVGVKVSITSPRPNTTRRPTRGVLHAPGAQAVFVDTPGLHRPKTALGRRLNDHVAGALADVDVVVAVVDATAAIGPGDRLVLQRAVAGRPAHQVLVAVNKVDAATPAQVLHQLSGAEAVVRQVLGAEHEVELFPVSAATGLGVEPLARAVLDRLPEGPAYFPNDMVSDTDATFWLAELVREQLLRATHDELPHAIACRVVEQQWPRVRIEIVVERPSQRAIVIGHEGSVLKKVGTAVRAQLPPGAYVELHVVVDAHWQQRPDAIEGFGY